MDDEMSAVDGEDSNVGAVSTIPKGQPTSVSFIPGQRLSYSTTRISCYFNQTLLSFGTGFVVKFGNEYGLVTAWHVLSGINPIDFTNLSSNGGRPNRIKFHLTLRWEERFEGGRKTSLFFKPMEITIEEDIDLSSYCIVKGTMFADVALIPLNSLVEELADPRLIIENIDCSRIVLGSSEGGETIRRADEVDDLSYMYPQAGSQVFMLGYPNGIQTHGVLPIWKRGSIASEPQGSVTYGGRSTSMMFYVDALSKSGMSGAPVIFRSAVGDILTTDKGWASEALDQTEHLLGVYSGREGVTDEEYQFALGRVWKTEVITRLFLRYLLNNRSEKILFGFIPPADS